MTAVLLTVVVDVDGVQVQKQQVIKGDISVITKPEEGQKFVSIDGKRTYINLFGEASSTKITPSTTQPTIIGTGYVPWYEFNGSIATFRLETYVPDTSDFISF